MPATKVAYVNGNIVSVDRDFSQHQAFLTEKDRIAAVGSDEKIRSLAGPNAEIVDLGGRTVLPGFIDMHGHLALFGIETLWVNLDGVTSVADVQERIRERVKSVAPGEPILTTPIGDGPYRFGQGTVLKEGRFPTRWELDEAAPDNPVYITAPTNRVPNSAIFNSAALDAAGLINGKLPYGLPNRMHITPEYIWLDGIKVLLDEKGEPTGELQNAHWIYNLSTYFDQITAFAGKPSEADLKESIRRLAPDFLRLGTTTLLENHLTRQTDLRAFHELNLPTRLYYTYELEGFRSLDEISALLDTIGFATGGGIESDRIGVVGVSVGLDGPHFHGAAFTGDTYVGPSGDIINPGPLVPIDHYKAILRLASERGFHIHAEGAGRGSIELVLETFEEINETIPLAERRNMLVHCEFPTQEQCERAAALNMTATTTTNFLWGKGAEAFIPRLGREYAEDAIPFRWWLDAGVVVCNETDWGPRSPLFAIWQSIARQAGATGEVVGPHQSVTREEAIRMMTWNCAYALHREDHLGSIEPGKYADFVVLDADPLTVPVDDIKDIQVLATAIGGELVFGSV